MKLDRITLENFRQYYGRQRLSFAKDRHQNVTIIHGVNGAGKTSLFLAILWCLYGRKTADGTTVIDNVGELVSKEACQQATTKEVVQTSVELAFLHNGDRYLVKRTLQATKQSDGSMMQEPTDEFTMMRTQADGQAIRVSNPVGTINAILPVNVREYFLFDGEKIDNFAKPEAAAQVQEAVRLVLKLEVLERARDDLKNAAQEYRRELKQVSSGELRNLLEADEKARAERARIEKRKDELEAEIESARRKIAEIEQHLRETENAQVQQQQRDRVERDLKLRRSEYETCVGQLRDLAISGYLVGAEPAVERAVEILDRKRERGEIPSNIRQQFVQDLIGQMKCICGRPFTTGSPEHERLLGLLSTRLPGSLEDDVLDTSAVLKGFGDRVQRYRSDLDTTMKRRATLVDFIRGLEGELDDVERQLRSSPLEEISKLEKQRQDFRADVDSYNVEIGRLEERDRKLAENVTRLEKDIAKARKDEQRERLLGAKLDLAQRSADAIKEMYQAFADDMRQRIEVKTKDIFKQLVWKGSHFQDVQLGPDFNLEVIDRYGLPARPELSAGERQVLSLSFITAMSRVSEEEAPLVMDTPFGRLSSQHRNSITQYLPELAHQLILFVTDEELRDQARANLESRIGAEYRLEFDPRSSCTHVVEV